MSELGVALDSLALGMWWSRRSAKVTLYILEDAEQFVFVCHPWERSKVPSVSALALSSASPFSEPGGGDVGGVVAFEVAWRNIMGIDYKNPLCSDGKVVFEAYSIQRRAFPSFQVAHRWYWTADHPGAWEADLDGPQLTPRRASLGSPIRSAEDCTWSRSSRLASVSSGGVRHLQARSRSTTALDALACADDAAEVGRVTQVYNYRSIAFTFSDPSVPLALRPAIMNDEKLLRLYESGLPSWAQLAPRMGVYYRPWQRRTTALLFYLFSVLSLAAGFYDLYRNLPGVQLLLRAVLRHLWAPSGFLQWLDAHTQMRLSLLLTYLLGKSEVFVFALRLWRAASGALRSSLVAPLSLAWTSFLAPLSALLRACAGLLADCFAGLSAAFAPLAPVASSAASAAAALGAHLAATLRQPGWWAAARAGGRAARAAAGPASQLASQGAAVLETPAWQPAAWVAPLLEAWAAARGSALALWRTLRALCSLSGHVGSSALRHRASLRLRRRRAVEGLRVRAGRAVRAWAPRRGGSRLGEVEKKVWGGSEEDWYSEEEAAGMAENRMQASRGLPAAW